MKQIKQEIKKLFEIELSQLNDKLYKEKILQLTEELFTWDAAKNGLSEFPEKIRLFYQTIDFLVHKSRIELDFIQELRHLRSDFNQRLTSSKTTDEKKELTLQFAKDLGASTAQLRGDKHAFDRWFGYDVVLERCDRKIAQAEYDLVFLLNRLGVVASKALNSITDESAQERILNHINIAKTLKPLLVFTGDERVRIETFRCLARIIRVLPPHIKSQNIEEEIITFIYRASLDSHQQIWIQCEAFNLLSLLDQDSFFQAATRRLFNPVGGDDFFVRRKAIQLLYDHIENEKEIKKFLSTISRDISPFARQAVPVVLIRFLVSQKPGTENEDTFSWLGHIMLKDISPQVRAATLLAIASSADLITSFSDRVSNLLFDHLSMEKDLFVLRVGFKALYDIVDCLKSTGYHEKANTFLEKQFPAIMELHIKGEPLSVRRWAALTREKLLIQTNDDANALMGKLSAIILHIKPGKKKRLPHSWFKEMDEDKLGRILSVLAQENFSLSLKKGIIGIYLFRGDRFGFRLWRFLYEIFTPSPDKREGFSHITGRKYSGHLRAPSGICSELTQTKVPGEPLYYETESGWRPYLPLVDEALSCSKTLFSKTPVKLFTSEGITEMYSPHSLFRKLIAYLSLTLKFSKYASLRNWQEKSQSQPDSYIKALKKLGFHIHFRGFKTTTHQKDEDPSVMRFFSVAFPFVTPDLWNQFKQYFFSVYDNSLYELGIFSAGLLFFFLFRSLYLSYAVIRARKKITLVIGGWGTRGKSGVERLKASLFEALGHGLVNKTTGCEAMFLHAFPFGKTREMFLFRPYDKATIWEHHNILCMTQKLKSKVFLWECMALSPPFVTILQQQWTRDDFSTITNTYPDHEDIQGPAGINIPQVMANFIPRKSVLITSEEQMQPILTQAAKEKETKIEYTGWLESGLLTSDVLGRFTYKEHPSNVALVLKLAKILDIDPDFAVREMAERVVPDLGALKSFPVASMKKRRIEFVNGMSANERFATIGNWKRMLFESHDYEKNPEIITSTLVNNRADRITRSRMFASIIVEDLNADHHFLIGSNLSGLLGFIDTAWEDYLKEISLFSKDNHDTEFSFHTFTSLSRKMRIPLSSDTIMKRVLSMFKDLEVELSETEIKNALTHPSSLIATIESKDLPTETREVIGYIEKWNKELEEFVKFQNKIKNEPPSKKLDIEFKKIITHWFKQKLIVIEDIHATGDQIINTICNYTPPGLLNRIMGIQNIKGTGLDYVYRWQAWESCYLAGQKLLNDKDPQIFDQGFNELIVFQDYGILCEDYMKNVLTQTTRKVVAQTEQYQAGFSMIESTLSTALLKIKERLKNETLKNSIKTKIAEIIESILDAGDAVKRRKIANQIYKDLIHERISHERAAIELKQLNQRQKGGWLKN